MPLTKDDMPQSVKGIQFLQRTVESSFESAIAGHQALTCFLLSGLVVLLCVFSGLIISFLGAFLMLNIVAQSLNESIGIIADPNDLTVLESCIAAFIVILSIVTAIFQRFAPSVLVTLALGIILSAVVFIVLVSQERLPPEFWLTAISATLVCLLISYLVFYVVRFADALADIVLIQSRWLKVITLLIMLPPATIGALAAVSTLQTDEVGLAKIFSALPASTLNQVTTAAILVGTLSNLALAFSAWLGNRRRGVPWKHPDLIRTLALIVGSWRGTSFHKLDLSTVSFRATHLANTDLRAQKLHRTCFQGATGLERARVDSRYMDLEVPKVQKLLTHGISEDPNFDRLNLRGAYLQEADLRRMSFIDADLSGADLQAADLRGAILARTQAIGADFSNANLTGICIQDWSVNSETNFSNVLCDYVYRELDEKGEPTDRYPADRNFELQEFESLYQEIGNVAELVFKEGVNWRAFSFSIQKLDLEDDGLGLELKGFERRGDRWVVRVTHNQHVSKQAVESRLLTMYDEMKGLLAAKEDQIHKLLGIASDQAESIKELSQKPFGNSFFITGSTITNLTGSGNIEYTEVAHQVREIINHGSDRKQAAPFVRQFVQQLKQQDVAATGSTQLELMEQLIISEAEADPSFRAYLLKESPQILQAMAGTPLAQVIEHAIAQLSSDEKSGRG